MGGYGSGRYQSYGAKRTVEKCLTLDIFQLRREGWLDLDAGRQGLISSHVSFTIEPDAIRLQYRMARTLTDIDMDYSIALISTTPNYGGQRPWFLCPHCDRRCGKLYLAPGRQYFLCRRCADLTYQSTRELSPAKAHRQILAIEAWANREMARLQQMKAKMAKKAQKKATT